MTIRRHVMHQVILFYRIIYLFIGLFSNSFIANSRLLLNTSFQLMFKCFCVVIVFSQFVTLNDGETYFTVVIHRDLTDFRRNVTFENR